MAISLYRDIKIQSQCLFDLAAKTGVRRTPTLTSLFDAVVTKTDLLIPNACSKILQSNLGYFFAIVFYSWFVAMVTIIEVANLR